MNEDAPSHEVILSYEKSRIDIAQVLLTFLTCGGDRFKTAACCNLSVDVVDELATGGDWLTKLNLRGKLAEDGKKTQHEVALELQRLTVRAQAQRIIDEINVVLLHLSKLPEDDKLRYLFEVKRDGTKKPTGAFYVELAKATETASNLLFRASQDQMPQRPEAETQEAFEGRATLGIGAELSKLIQAAQTPKEPQ
jgi:hypothetical protein